METARLIEPKKLTHMLRIGYIEQYLKYLKTKGPAQFSVD